MPKSFRFDTPPFSSYQHRVGKTDEAANAIYMNNFGHDDTLNLAAKDGKSVLLYDPVQSNSANGPLTIDINKLAASTPDFMLNFNEFYYIISRINL